MKEHACFDADVCEATYVAARLPHPPAMHGVMLNESNTCGLARGETRLMTHRHAPRPPLLMHVWVPPRIHPGALLSHQHLIKGLQPSAHTKNAQGSALQLRQCMGVGPPWRSFQVYIMYI